MIILPGVIYAEEGHATLEATQEQYILERTGDILVKIFGNIELDGRETSRTQVLLTHNTPDGISETHYVRTNNHGYYEFYFVHNWDSTRGNYDVNVMGLKKGGSQGFTPEENIGSISYELIEDPTYKSDKQVKEEYWIKEEKKRQVINTAINAWEYYEENKKESNYWMKNIFHWYYTHAITEEEVIDSIKYLAINEILKFD